MSAPLQDSEVASTGGGGTCVDVPGGSVSSAPLEHVEMPSQRRFQARVAVPLRAVLHGPHDHVQVSPLAWQQADRYIRQTQGATSAGLMSRQGSCFGENTPRLTAQGLRVG